MNPADLNTKILPESTIMRHMHTLCMEYRNERAKGALELAYGVKL